MGNRATKRILARETEAERIRRAIAEGASLMTRLNPSRFGDTMNCPSAAASMMHFLGTGEVVPAEVGDPDSDAFETAGTRLRRSSWAQIKTSLANGQYLAVHAQRTPEAQRATGYAEEHWFVLARSGGQLYVLDASLRMVLSGTDIDEWIRQNQLSNFSRVIGTVKARLVRGAQRDRELGIEPPRAEPPPASPAPRRPRRTRARPRRQRAR